MDTIGKHKRVESNKQLLPSDYNRKQSILKAHSGKLSKGAHQRNKDSSGQRSLQPAERSASV